MRPIHILAFAALLSLPAGLQAQEAQGYAPSREASADIVETAKGAGTFNTLAKAIEAAGLTETLKGEGPFTVFAPTDEAFDKLPAGTLESLLQDREKLATILKYHVVPGKVSSSQAMEISEAKTAAEKSLPISKASGKLMVGTATVTKADIPASNGVIHVIDTVLLPE
ncbi:MAG TPA: fasciclin domain-containing protein [Gemmatimonadales bacterium]